MGCLKKILFNIVLLAVVVAFFYFGGGKIAGDMIKRYQNPPREVVIKSASVFGDFNGVESDYQIGRTLKLPNYSKMTVNHKPSGQKIRFVKLPKDKAIDNKDFGSKIADEKLQNFIKSNNIEVLSFDDIKINTSGKVQTKNKNIDYANFTITIEKPLHHEIIGFIGLHNIMKNDEIKNQILILSLRGKDKFSEKIVRDLLQTVELK